MQLSNFSNNFLELVFLRGPSISFDFSSNNNNTLITNYCVKCFKT